MPDGRHTEDLTYVSTSPAVGCTILTGLPPTCFTTEGTGVRLKLCGESRRCRITALDHTQGPRPASYARPTHRASAIVASTTGNPLTSAARSTVRQDRLSGHLLLVRRGDRR